MKIKKSWNDVQLFYNYNENEIKIIQKKMSSRTTKDYEHLFRYIIVGDIGNFIKN